MKAVGPDIPLRLICEHQECVLRPEPTASRLGRRRAAGAHAERQRVARQRSALGAGGSAARAARAPHACRGRGGRACRIAAAEAAAQRGSANNPTP